MKRLSSQELASKVRWEGGAFEALRYGLRSGEIDDEELAELWHRMEQVYERISPIAWRIEFLLSRAA